MKINITYLFIASIFLVLIIGCSDKDEIQNLQNKIENLENKNSEYKIIVDEYNEILQKDQLIKDSIRKKEEQLFSYFEEKIMQKCKERYIELNPCIIANDDKNYYRNAIQNSDTYDSRTKNALIDKGIVKKGGYLGTTGWNDDPLYKLRLTELGKELLLDEETFAAMGQSMIGWKFKFASYNFVGVKKVKFDCDSINAEVTGAMALNYKTKVGEALLNKSLKDTIEFSFNMIKLNDDWQFADKYERFSSIARSISTICEID